jgi:hypothetical protein
LEGEKVTAATACNGFSGRLQSYLRPGVLVFLAGLSWLAEDAGEPKRMGLG